MLDPATSKNNNILGVLDFDLSYDLETFVNTMEPDIEFGKETFDKMKSNLGKQDREQFDDWVNSEKYELEASLGGQENMANFTYAGMEEKEINPAISDISILAEVCLRDACVLNYRHAYNKQGPLW